MRTLLAFILTLAACNGDKPQETAEPDPTDTIDTVTTDTDVPPAGGDACLTCHEGIEQVHGAIPADQCVVCHGGDGDATAKELAHIAIPDNWETVRGTALPPSRPGFIEDFAPNQLDQISPAYLQFINPGDIRVVDATCGVCHEDHVEKMPNSIMSTNAGHYYPTMFLSGMQDDQDAHIGSIPAVDPDCDLTIEGTVCSLEILEPIGDAALLTDILSLGTFEEIEATSYEHYLAKNCNTCHQAGYPKNDSPGLYRSSGCTSCHMVYDTLGTYTGGDPTIVKGSPTHPSKHVITTAITTEQCATCHFQGGRIGLLYQGIREGGFSTKPPNGLSIDETLYAKAPGFYFLDEDTTNNYDETPPDLHHDAGMVCADCHVGQDVHGNGRIYSNSKGQETVQCEDCHGTVRESVAPDADGIFYTAKDRNPLKQLSLDAFGQVILTGKMDQRTHIVPQAKTELEKGASSADMHAAMGVDAAGWSHTDTLTCDTCHTSYQQTCIGCHVTVDYRLEQIDYQTGTSTPGLTRGSRSFFSLDTLLLGLRSDGKIQQAQASQQVQLTVYGSVDFGTLDGELLEGGLYTNPTTGATSTVGAFREAQGSLANNGFAPFFQHTSSAKARACATCHPTDTTPEEIARIKGVLGYGTGEFMLPGADGTLVDGLQFLNADGSMATTWSHEGTGPLTPEQQARVLGTIVSP